MKTKLKHGTKKKKKPLLPLAPAAAMRLFEERAQALVPAFAITDDTRPLIAEICSRLDQLPLAIELAAARIPVLQPDALLDRLQHRLELLTHGPRDGPARLRTLRDAIAWSHDLLSVNEQTLFRRLSVFAGGFTLDAAESVAGNGEPVLESLSALVENSLVNAGHGAESHPRFGMLETIREYALERLHGSGEEAEHRRKHADYYLAQAEQLWAQPVGIGTELEVKRLKPEHGNFRTALAWMLEHDPVLAASLAGGLDAYWFMLGHFAEGRDWLMRVLDTEVTMPVDVRARALFASGWLAHQQMDVVAAESQLNEAVNCCREIDDNRLLATALGRLGSVALSQGDIVKTQRLYDEELRLANEDGDLHHVAVATLNQGRCLAAVGKLVEAETVLEDALAQHRQWNGPYAVAVAQIFLGEVALARGNQPRAAEYYQGAIGVFAAAGDRANVSRCLEGLAGVAVSGQPRESARLLGASAEMRRQIGHPVDMEDLPAYERTLETARARLTEEAFAASWDAGKDLSRDDAIACALAITRGMLGAQVDQPSATGPIHDLTRRELDVLRLLVDGRSNRSIAQVLSISERTVDNHVLHILTKLDVESRTAAAIFAVRHGLA